MCELMQFRNNYINKSTAKTSEKGIEGNALVIVKVGLVVL